MIALLMFSGIAYNLNHEQQKRDTARTQDHSIVQRDKKEPVGNYPYSGYFTIPPGSEMKVYRDGSRFSADYGWSSNHKRNKTYQGIADAMAKQWGNLQ